MSVIRNSSSRSQARKSRSSPYSRIVDNALGRVSSFVGWIYNIRNQATEPSLPTHSDEATTTTVSSEKPDSNDQDVPRLESTNGPPRVSASTRAQDLPPSNGPNSESSESGIAQESTSFTFQFTAPGVEPVSFSSTNTNSQPTTPTPRKKLARNPNGSYRWEGAGSAKHPRTRNRYASPVFGVSPSKSERLLMRDSTNTGETPLPDGKRRKVGEEPLPSSDSSKNASSVPFPHTASPTTPRTNGVNGVSARPNALSSTSRLRTPAKPTAPAIPSPLRQAWSDASSASSREDPRASPPQAAKQTQAASFMAELIKETTPPKKPDLSNPYQVASPVGKVGPPRRGTKRPRATGKPPAPTKDRSADEQITQGNEKEKEEYSPQAIIEATLPKGSKRSRPPPHLEKRIPEDSSQSPPAQREPPVVVETRKVTYVVEEPEEDEDESRRATKRTKPSVNGHGPPPSARQKTSTLPSSADIVVEEVDVNMTSIETENQKIKETPKLSTQANDNVSTSPLSATSPTSRLSFNGLKSSSIPKEPSKLRFSFQAETPATSPLPFSTSAPTQSPQPTPPLPKTDFKFSPPSSGFNFTFKSDSKDAEKIEKPDVEAIKEKVWAMPTSSLPVFAFGVEGTSVLPNSAGYVELQNEVKALPVSSLPSFDFGSSKSASFSFDYDPSKTKTPGSYSGSYKASPPKANKPAVVRPISSPSPASSTPAPAPVEAFDFAGAGMRAPIVAKDSKICAACGLSSPASASKCTVCDEPFPGSASASTPPPASTPTPPAPPAVGFNWAAAGMKPPSAAKGAWKCSDCGLDSPEAKIECTVCGAPKP